VLLLQAMCLAEPAGSTADEVTNALADARAELRTAEEHLRRLDEQTADLAGELDGLIAAAHDARCARTATDTPAETRAQRLYLALGATFRNGTPRWPEGLVVAVEHPVGRAAKAATRCQAASFAAVCSSPLEGTTSHGTHDVQLSFMI
jgi:hypothetical protein